MSKQTVICPKAATCTFEPKTIYPHCRPHDEDATCDKRMPVCPACVPVQQKDG